MLFNFCDSATSKRAFRTRSIAPQTFCAVTFSICVDDGWSFYFRLHNQSTTFCYNHFSSSVHAPGVRRIIVASSLSFRVYLCCKRETSISFRAEQIYIQCCDCFETPTVLKAITRQHQNDYSTQLHFAGGYGAVFDAALRGPPIISKS